MRPISSSVLRSWMTRAACAAGAILGAGLLSPAASDAGLFYDLRFSDGSSSKVVSGAGNLTLELWARVSGDDFNHANDAFHSGIIVLQSNEIANGVLEGALAAPGGDTRVAPFNDFFSSAIGTGSDLNGDGIGDWSSTDADAADPDYMYARSASPTYGGAGVGQAVNATTWEFKLGTWTLQIASLIANPQAGAETRIMVTQPVFTTGLPAYATFYDDDPNPAAIGGQTNVTSGNSAGVYGDFVTITVPEPTTLAALTIGGLALLSRRRSAK